MEKGSLKGAQMRAFYFLPQNIHVNHPSIFDKYFYICKIYLSKRKRSVTMISVERRGGFLMGAVWIIFIPFLLIFYASSEKKIKRLNKRIRRLEKQVKGNQDMSRLLEELKGQTATVLVSGVGFEYEILDIDEDWVKLTRVNNKQQSETKLVRIEDIQDVQL